MNYRNRCVLHVSFVGNRKQTVQTPSHFTRTSWVS